MRRANVAMSERSGRFVGWATRNRGLVRERANNPRGTGRRQRDGFGLPDRNTWYGLEQSRDGLPYDRLAGDAGHVGLLY
jgi:hypothetical protein